MRIPSAFLVMAALCAVLVSPAAAQTESARPEVPACDGIYNILRISEITPTGSIEKFMEAVAAHQAWYASHGYPDIVFAARVVERDPGTNTITLSNKTVLTYHYSKGPVPPAAHDAAWDAYVKLYNETSTIKETHMNCVPAAGVPAALK